jgi:NADPH:quinone reductase-like Zn-dependent oxidoreductase
VAKILEWAAAGKIRPPISHAYPLAEFRTAMLARWNGAVTGGCVLHP